ncbi:MAG: hypothetical protein DRG24_02745 [Epsilonproteobacteria bacterium]|nr:MAG: hypothetical protein DRG24_02745 [Campylobacterota bacterium]
MHKYKLISLLTSGFLLLTTNTYAKPNLPPPVEDMVKLKKLAGGAGPFTAKESFPKSYFLIAQNLPYLIGLALYHPASSELNLSKKQIGTLLKLKKDLTPAIIEKAVKIKKLEIEVVEAIALKYKAPKAETQHAKIDKIAKLQAALTKSHLICIEKVKAILTEEQYEELLDYAIINMF